MTTQFQLSKRYASGGFAYIRPITKPVLGTVRVGNQGTELQESIHWEVDLTTGVLTFDTPPDINSEVTAGFEFDVPVRFDTDLIQTSVASFKAGNVPNVPVVEVRV